MKNSTFSAVMANSIKNLLQGYTKGIRFVAVLTMLLTMGIGQAWGADVTYTVSSTNAVTTSGTAPTSSTAAYSQTFNTACQITRGKSATLTLTDLGGINISNITLSMKSNKSAGAGKLSYSTDGGSTWTYLVGSNNSTVNFNNASWNGSYTQTYTDISKTVSLSNVTKLIIKIEATTNSLYCQSYKITYTAASSWKIKGSWDGWTEHAMTVNGTEATCQIDLAQGQVYDFCFDGNGSFYKNSGAIITDISGWVFSTDANDARLYTGPAGTYTFKINTSTKQVQVIYPTVTHPAEGYAYFQKQDSWNGFKVYNYTSETDRLSDLPGSPSVTNTTTICGKTYYYTALATQFQKVIFRDNDSNQWKEISVSGYSGKYCGDDYNATPQTWKTFNKYSITFNSNGGSGTMSTISGICPGDNQTLPANTFTRTGYTFDGWATSANGNEAYNDKEPISNINSNITLYARWKANTYTITSNLTNCSSSPAIPASYTYTGSAANLTYTITAASGYRLPDAITVSGCAYTWDKTTGQLKLTGTISGNVTITIEAVKVYTITWKVNKQTYTTGSPTTSVDDGATYKNLTLPTAPANNTLNECYNTDKKFVGWSTTNIGSTESDKPTILFKTAAEAPNTAITDNTTLYAVFATENGGGTSTVSVFFEDFSTITSGNSTLTSGSGSTWTKNSNFNSVSAAYQAGGAVKLGTGSAIGYLVTKQLTAAVGETLTISFKVKGWSSVEGQIQVSGNNSEFTQPSAISYSSTMSGSFETKSVSVVLTKANPYIKIATTAKRAFIDDIQITKTTTSAPTYSNYVTECCTLNNINLDNSGTTTGGTFSAEANNACKGEEITLSAKAANCYAFDSWTIKKTSDGSDVTNSVLDGNTLTMPDYAVTVYATFKSLSVTEITLSMTDGHKNLDVGETNQLLVDYTPIDATCDNAIVSWTSSDDNVMSVTDGLVKALRAGTATITATTEGGVTATYTITINNPTCDSWYIHYWNNSTSGDECFYKVKPDDPNDHEWRTNNFSLPSFSNEDMFNVNNAQAAGGDSQKTDQIFRTGIGFADIQRGGQDCGTKPYPGQDAYGQLSIYDDSNSPNRYIAFYPAQYMVTFGKEGSSWEEMPLNNTTGYEYESEPFMVPNGYKTDDTYKYWVGITDKDGNIKYVGYEFDDVEYKKSSVDAMNTVNGLSTSDMAGKWGVWHIYSNSCANNWYCEFIHYYRVEFNLNGGEGDIAPRYGKAAEPYVTFSTSDITAPTRDGYTFLGWKDQNNIIYAPTGATVTINNDFTLTALWKENYASDNCRWIETDIEDIEYGDEVIITMTSGSITWALDQDYYDTKNSNYPLATQVLVSGQEIPSTQIFDKIKWNISGNATDGYVLYPNGQTTQWLYCTGSNNTIKIGTGSLKHFVIENGYLKSKSKVTTSGVEVDAFLGVSSSTNSWRHYPNTTTSVIADQTLKFYKRECLDASKVWVEGNLTNVTCSPQLPQQLAKDGSITLTFTAADGYELPNTVTVTNATKTWNQATGTLTISNPTGNVMVTVEALQVKTVTFSVDSEDTAPTEMQAEENTDITLPAFTTNLTCVKFVGWIDPANEATITSGNIYKAGDSYTVTDDITLKAVYAAGGGFVLVTDENDFAVGDRIVIAAAGFDVAMGGQNTNNRAKVDVEKDDTDNTITTPDGIQILTLEAGTVTEDANSIPIITYAFNTGSGYLYAASSSSNYLKTQATNNANGSWTISITSEGVATIEAQGSNSRNWLRYNSGSSIFSCYASGQLDVSIYKESITGYTTDPECEEYDITLEVIGHANGSAKINGQTATPTTSQTVTILNTKMATISDVANVAGYDVTVSKRSGNATFTDNGDGTWAVSEPASNVTIQVQYTAKQIYKVQFVTGTGGTGSFTSLDAYKGQTVTIPANYEAVGLCGEFVGWTEEAKAIGEKPTKLYQPGDPFTLNSNGTRLYAVYSISASCTSEFALGKSGDYEMYAIYSNNVYYATQKSGSDYFYANTEADIEANARVKSTFRMQYDATQTAAWNEQDVYAYTIYISNGDTEFGFWHLTSTGGLDFDATEPYYWKVKSYNGGYDIYGEVNGNTYRITCNGSNFNVRKSADAVYLTPGGGIEYWTDIDCSDINVDVTFVWNQFESWPVGMPNANSYKGLAKCSEITEFPVALQEGWTFLGWSTKEYNALHADDLDDENNASRAYPDGSDIYKTGGNTLTLGSADITLYPVFTRYEENEPLNLVNGGEFYMYVKPGDTDVYGGVRRFYIADVNLSSGGFTSTEDCNDARPFTFIKEDAGWLIQFVDEGGKTYYLGANAAANDLTKHQTNKTYWDITVGTGNNPANAYRMMAIGQGSESALLATVSNGLTSATFKYYAIENLINTPSVYFDIFLGSCEDRVFSSDPTSKPSVTITGGGYVTGSKGQTVFVPSAFTITGKNLNDNYNVNIADVGGLLKFYNEAGNVISNFGKPVGGKLAQTTFYVAYTPTADTDGTEIPSIIVTNGTGGSALNQEITDLIHARHLPAEFAIVAKIGGNWYALPDTALHVQTPEGLLVEVDNVDSPTAVTQSFCNATAWSLRGVKNTRYVVNSVLNGDNVLFAETNTGVIDNRKMLYAGEDSKVGASATYTNYTATNPDRYEWQLTTTDNITYTVNSNSTIVSDPLSVNNSRAFGTHGKFVASEEIRLLPIEGPCIAPAVFQVIEWKTNGMIIMYTGAGVSATTQVGTYAASDAKMTEVDHGVYELTTSQDLTACTGLKLAITFTDASSNKTQKVLVIPAIISGEKGSTSLVASNAVAKVTDVVVLDDAKLTADDTQYTYNDVVVYPGGKLVIGNSGKLGMYALTLRLGSSWGAAEYEHKYPQFVLNAPTDAYSNSSGKINLDYVTTKEQYYTFVAPFDVKTKDIKYPVDIYGNNVAAANKGSFEFQYYDGAARAEGNTGWKVVEEDPTNGATLNAGQGYTFLGMPKKVSVNGGTSTRQKFGIHRIPMTVAAGTAMDHETNDQTAPLSVYLCDKNNNSGWNLIGNPYMSTIAGLTNEDIQVGKLVHTNDANGKWTGGWHWDTSTEATNQRFLVIPSNDGQSYKAVQVSNATPLPAFKNFFVQISNKNATALSIPVANRVEKSLAPARYAEEQPEKDVEVAIVLEQDEAHSDQMDFLINNIYTEDFERDADFTKMMNATNLNLYGVHPYDNLSFVAIDNNTARGSVAIGYQVPQAGEYILRMSDKPYVMFDKIEALYVTDHEMSPEITTDIMSEPYRFTVAKAETNHTRFTVSVILKTEEDDGGGDVGTGVDNTTNSNTPYKFIYQDKMYILLNGVIYDAMGKQVQTINK